MSIARTPNGQESGSVHSHASILVRVSGSDQGSTVIVSCIDGWILQVMSYVPASSKV